MRYDEHDTCSVCGDFINDVGGCDTCHGDPYWYDEWYEEDEDYGDYDSYDEDGGYFYNSDDYPEQPEPTRLDYLMDGLRNLIGRICP